MMTTKVATTTAIVLRYGAYCETPIYSGIVFGHESFDSENTLERKAGTLA